MNPELVDFVTRLGFIFGDAAGFLNDLAEFCEDFAGFLDENSQPEERDDLEELLEALEEDDEDDEDDACKASWPNVSDPAASAFDVTPPPPATTAPLGCPTAPLGWPNVAPAQVDTAGCDVTQVASTLTWPNVGAPTTPNKTSQVVNQKPDVLRKVVSVDHRGRACVPAEFIKAIGLKPDDVAYVALRAGGDGLVILPYEPATGEVTAYYVDGHHNVRLTQWALAKGKIPGDVKFRTTDNRRGIIVLPA